MCEKCKAIDKKIGHYRKLATLVTDGQTLDGIGILIAKLEPIKRSCTPQSKANQSQFIVSPLAVPTDDPS